MNRRSNNRVSQALIGMVAVALFVGTVAWFKKPTPTKANEPVKQAAEPAKVQQLPVAAKPVEKPKNTGQISLGKAGNGVVVTQTPGEPKVATPAPTVSKNIQIAMNDPRPTTPAPSPKPADNAATPPKPAPAAAPVQPRTGDPIAEGKAQIDAGNLLAGRQILNSALINNQLNADEAKTAKQLIAQANEVIIFSPRRFPEDSFQGSHQVTAGDKAGRIAANNDVTWEFLGRVNKISDARRLRAGNTIKTIKGPFHAVVSKSAFTMDIYLGSPGDKGAMFVRTFNVGLGKHGSTPIGTWMLTPQSKLKNPKWWGTGDEPAREADDPLNPLGEFWMGLTGVDGEAQNKEGFGIHGTIDPDSIGKEMSHGCIRLVNDDVAQVYDMLTDGRSTVIVKE